LSPKPDNIATKEHIRKIKNESLVTKVQEKSPSKSKTKNPRFPD